MCICSHIMRRADPLQRIVHHGSLRSETLERGTTIAAVLTQEQTISDMSTARRAEANADAQELAELVEERGAKSEEDGGWKRHSEQNSRHNAGLANAVNCCTIRKDTAHVPP